MTYNHARNQIYRVKEGGTGNHRGGAGRDRNRTDPCLDKGRGPLIYSLWGLPSDLHASRVPSSLVRVVHTVPTWCPVMGQPWVPVGSQTNVIFPKCSEL